MKSTMKIVAYYRVSTKKQGKSGLGLDAQKQAVSDYARHNSAKIIAEYTEVETGKTADRPKLAEAIGHAKLSGAILVVAKLDRLARNVSFTAKLMEEGVDFIACDNPHANRVTIHILAAIAENEAQSISKRTKEALAAARANGVKLGSARPGHWSGKEHRRGWKKGVKNSADARRQRAKNAYATLMPRIHAWANEGYNQREIAKMLNDEHLQTTAGKPFTGVTICRLLQRYPQTQTA